MNNKEKQILENIKYKHECDYVTEADDEFLFNLIDKLDTEQNILKEKIRHLEIENSNLKADIEINCIRKSKIENKLKDYENLKSMDIEMYRKTHCRIIEIVLHELLEGYHDTNS